MKHAWNPWTEENLIGAAIGCLEDGQPETAANILAGVEHQIFDDDALVELSRSFEWGDVPTRRFIATWIWRQLRGEATA